MPLRPPKWWFKKCVKAQSRKKTRKLRIRDPYRLCGYIWYHHTGQKRRKQILAIERRRLAAIRRSIAKRVASRRRGDRSIFGPSKREKEMVERLQKLGWSTEIAKRVASLKGEDIDIDTVLATACGRRAARLREDIRIASRHGVHLSGTESTLRKLIGNSDIDSLIHSSKIGLEATQLAQRNRARSNQSSHRIRSRYAIVPAGRRKFGQSDVFMAIIEPTTAHGRSIIVYRGHSLTETRKAAQIAADDYGKPVTVRDQYYVEIATYKPRSNRSAYAARHRKPRSRIRVAPERSYARCLKKQLRAGRPFERASRHCEILAPAYPSLDRSTLDRIRSTIESRLGLGRRKPRKTSVKICRKYDLHNMATATATSKRRRKISLKGWYPSYRRPTKESECLSYARHYTKSWRKAFHICLAAQRLGVHPREILKEQRAPVTED